MPCGGLGTLDVFSDIVDVGEDRRAEASGLDGFGETRLLLDAGTHSPDLNVGQWFLPTQHEVVWECRQQVLFNMPHKGNGPLAGFGLRFAHHAQIAGWVSDGPLDVDGVSIEVEVLPLEAEHFFGAKRMQRRQSDGGHPVLRWNMDNAFVRTDPAGNLKIDKEKSTEKVDGAVALVMALDRAMKDQNAGSVYDDRGLLVL